LSNLIARGKEAAAILTGEFFTHLSIENVFVNSINGRGHPIHRLFDLLLNRRIGEHRGELLLKRFVSKLKLWFGVLTSRSTPALLG
jgi:hypothetical protein